MTQYFVQVEIESEVTLLASVDLWLGTTIEGRLSEPPNPCIVDDLPTLLLAADGLTSLM